MGQESEEKVIRRVKDALAYSNKWVSVYFDHVLFPDGTDGRYNRVVEYKTGKGVVVLPLSSEGKLCLVRIFRYPIGRWQWEVPRGWVEPGTSNEENAKRELAEETGLVSNSLRLIGLIYPNSGLLTTEATVFVALNLEKRALDADPKEVIRRVEFFGAEQIENMIQKEELCDAFTLASLSLARTRGFWKTPAGY